MAKENTIGSMQRIGGSLKAWRAISGMTAD